MLTVRGQWSVELLGGETIKALQQYTGAMIQIDQSCEPTKVTVAGSAQSLQLAVSMVRDIVAGNFKGFALLRQLTSGTGPQLPQGYEQLSQAQPVYVEGYGFVPPSQVPSFACPVCIVTVHQGRLQSYASVEPTRGFTPIGGTSIHACSA